MPQFVNTVLVPAPLDRVFAFFRTPENHLLLAQPELHLEIVTAPPLLELGSRVELKGRRWGITHHTALEITALEMGKAFVEEQRAGPFRQWKHLYRFESAPQMATLRLTDEVTFEPPGGMLGLIVTTAFVERELTSFFQFRDQRLRELLADQCASGSE